MPNIEEYISNLNIAIAIIKLVGKEKNTSVAPMLASLQDIINYLEEPEDQLDELSALLSGVRASDGTSTDTVKKPRRGRPKGSTNKVAEAPTPQPALVVKTDTTPEEILTVTNKSVEDESPPLKFFQNRQRILDEHGSLGLPPKIKL